MGASQKLRHQALDISDEQAVAMYRAMLKARLFDEHIWTLHRSGQINTIHVSSMGHEATQVGSVFAFEVGKDYFNPYYRDLAAVVAIGTSLTDLLMPYYGKAPDPSSGSRQIMAHFGNKNLNIVAQSSCVATQILHAVGIAFAAKYKKKDFVSFVSFGEGATSEGDFHEGLNFAGVWNLPVVFICENNYYAISVGLDKQTAETNLSQKAVAYGFPGVSVDGNDILAVYQAVKQAVDRARIGQGPTLIECRTYRPVPHSTSDDDRAYRSREEVQTWREKDPIERFKDYLMKCNLLTKQSEADMRQEFKAEIHAAQKAVEDAPFPEPEEAIRPIFAEVNYA